MSTHTEEEMEKMSLEELKANAVIPEPEKPAEDKTEPEEIAEPEIFIARREIDLGEGAGMEVFEAEGASEKEALEALADKMADAKLNASKKIRQQEAELRDFRTSTAAKPEAKKLTDDEKFLFQQEFQKDPCAAIDKYFADRAGRTPEELGEALKILDETTQNKKQKDAADIFVATHPDYEDGGQAGVKNAELLKMKLAEMRLTITSENLSKAYNALKQSGLLTLKNAEEAHADTTEKAKETERIAQPRVEAAQTRTKKASSIGTHSRTASVPANAELSEDEAYKLPMEKLRELANKQLAVR